MRRGLNLVHTLHRCSAGGVAIEFAIVATLFMLVSVSVLEFGRGLYIYNQIAYATDIGARRILLDNAITDGTVKNEIRGAFIAGNSNLLKITLGEKGNYRTLEISYPLNLLIPNRASVNLRLTRQIPLTNPPT